LNEAERGVNEPEGTARRSIRLPGYDYRTPGAYFVTICAYRRKLLFEDEAIASVIKDAWSALPGHFTNVGLDAFVVMPNHVHGVIWIRGAPVGARHASPLRDQPAGPEPGSLGAIVGSFKSAVSRELRLLGLHDSTPVWQRNYYERIIRNAAELNRIREYIVANPALWNFNHENPSRMPEPLYDEAWSWLENA